MVILAGSTWDLATGRCSEDTRSGSGVGKEAGEQFVFRSRERIRDRDPLPRKPLLQVFRQKESAACFGRSGKSHRIPNTELMIGGQVRCSKYHLGRRLDQRKRIPLTQDRFPRFCRRSPGLTHQQAEQFTQSLHGQLHSASRQRFYQLERRPLHIGSVNTLSVGQDVRVQRDPHCLSS